VTGSVGLPATQAVQCIDEMAVCVNKSQCIRFGRTYNAHCTALTTVSREVINLVDCSRYLGVFCNSGYTFKCNFDNANLCFFRAFNAFSNKVGRLASEEVLVKSYSRQMLTNTVIICD